MDWSSDVCSSDLCHSAAPLIRRAMAVLAVFLCLVGVSTIAHAETADVQTAWRLLDYMAVDYGGAVSGGRVKSASEYAEMTEFAASVSDRLMALPPTPARGQLITGATQLRGVIAAQGEPKAVARIAHGLAADLLQAYPVHPAPKLGRAAVGT